MSDPTNSSSKKQKKRSVAGLKNDDDDYDEHELNCNNSNKKKKARRTKSTSNNNENSAAAAAAEGIDIFSVDMVATTVFGYLDVRSLLRLANTSQFLRDVVTYKHVIRGAMMHGGHAKQSMERLGRLIEHRHIWIPSPLRLLRLVNGKRCECCNQGKANMVNPDYGTFFCWTGCIQGRFSKKVAMNNKWLPFLKHPRVAKAGFFSNAYVFTQPYRDKTGHMAGPLMSIPQMDAVRRGQDTLEEMFHAMDDRDPHAKHAEEIVQLWKDCQTEASNREEEKQQRKKQATTEAIERKKLKTAAFIETLSNELDDSKPWKEVAMRHRWWDQNVKTSSGRIVSFDLSCMNEILSDCLKAPSKATKKKMLELKETISGIFDAIWESKLYNFGFLSDSNELEVALKASLSEEFSDYEHLNYLTQSQRESLKDGTFNPWQFLNEKSHHELRNIFADVYARNIVESSVSDTSPELQKFALELAKSFWVQTRLENTDYDLESVHREGLKQFATVYPAAKDFLSSAEAQAWREENDPANSGLIISKLVGYCQRSANIENLFNRKYDIILQCFTCWKKYPGMEDWRA